MQSKAQQASKELLAQLHKSNSSSSVVDRKALKLDSAVKTLSAVETAKKSNTTAKAEKERDIKAFNIVSVDNKDLSKFEQSSYMHKSLDNNKAQLFLSDDKSEHKTVYFNKASNKFEVLSKDRAKDIIKAHMQANSATKRIYRTSDFQQLLQSASSSYTDMIRSACRELASEKFLLMSKIQDTERTRAKYQYELLKK